MAENSDLEDFSFLIFHFRINEDGQKGENRVALRVSEYEHYTARLI